MASILALLIITMTIFDAGVAVFVGTFAQATGTVEAVLSSAVLIIILALFASGAWTVAWAFTFFTTFLTTWTFNKFHVLDFFSGFIALVGSMASILASLVITVTIFDAGVAVIVGTLAQATGTVEAVLSSAVLIVLV